MSSTQRPRTARELIAAAGQRYGSLVLAAVVALAMPTAAFAQDGAPRDPMKPDRSGNEPKVQVSEHMTVDLHVKDEDLANVLELLSIQTQKNIIASKNVSGRVTATLYGVTFYQALDAILHVNGFGYMENGNFIYVYTQEELKQIEAALKKRVAKVIRLNYLNANDAKEFVTPLLSKDGGEIRTNSATKDFALSDKAPSGSDSYALGATIVVIDYEENIAAIEELVRQIDTRPAQVLVEATILQTALNEANAFGVDFAFIEDLDFSNFMSLGGPLAAVNSLIKGGDGSEGNGFTPSDNKGLAGVSNPGNTSGPGTFKLGILTDDISVFIRLLDQVSDTQILSNPKLLALNRQPSRVLVGRRVGYLQTTSTETSTTQSVEFLDTGTQLYFRPFVSEHGEIRMELKPQVSAAEIREVTDANGAAVTIPDEVTQELTTNVNVRDGQTIVLGGLFTESTSFTRRQVPFLGDIPIVGNAFRGQDDTTARSEIIFMITPTIVTDAILADAAASAQSDAEHLRAGSRQGLLPWSRDRMTAALNVEAERLAREGKHDEALWNIQRSLSLNPQQPEALRLRERITGERERWPNRSLLDAALDSEVRDRLRAVEPAAEPQKHYKPKGNVDLPREPVQTRAGATGESAQNWRTANAPSTAVPLVDASNDPRLSTVRPTSSVPADQHAMNTAAAPITGSDTAVATVQAWLPTLRGQIELFSAANQGQLPRLGSDAADGWSPMVSSLPQGVAPVNPYVGGPNAARVVMGTRPDLTYHTNYGWVFNPKTGQLWAAGFDGSDNPLPIETAGSGSLDAAVSAMIEEGTTDDGSASPTDAATQATAATETTESAPAGEIADPFEDYAWSLWFGFSPNEAFGSLIRQQTTDPTWSTAGVESEGK